MRFDSNSRFLIFSVRPIIGFRSQMLKIKVKDGGNESEFGKMKEEVAQLRKENMFLKARIKELEHCQQYSGSTEFSLQDHLDEIILAQGNLA